MGASADGTSLRTKVINYNQGNFRQLFRAADGNNMWFFTRENRSFVYFSLAIIIKNTFYLQLVHKNIIALPTGFSPARI